MNLNELIYNENSLLIKMRMDNYFDEHDYELIKIMINEKIPYWKERGEIPIKDFLAIVDFLIKLLVRVYLWMKRQINELQIHIWKSTSYYKNCTTMNNVLSCRIIFGRGKQLGDIVEIPLPNGQYAYGKAF